MSPRRWTDRGQDILEAMAEIQSFTQDMDFGTFEIDAKTIKAVLCVGYDPKRLTPVSRAP